MYSLLIAMLFLIAVQPKAKVYFHIFPKDKITRKDWLMKTFRNVSSTN